MSGKAIAAVALAILAAGAMIAAAIALTNHWTLVETPSGLMGMVRLDRWTGELKICVIDPDTIGSGMAGAELRCALPTPKTPVAERGPWEDYKADPLANATSPKASAPNQSPKPEPGDHWGALTGKP
jgi:hypothetical protein